MYRVAQKTSYLPLAAFLFLGIVWGSNFIYMKLAASLITPTQIVFFRVLFGFFPVLFYAYLSGAMAWQHLRYTGHFFVMSLLATTLYYYAFVKGTTLLLSGVAGALSGSIPLFSFVLAILFLPEEKITLSRTVGLIIGLIGVLIIGRPSGHDFMSTNMEGVLYLVAGSLSVGASFVYAKKYITPLKIPAAALTAYQLGIGLLLLAVVTNYQGIGNVWTDVHASIGLVVGLGLLGTGGAYIIYYFIIERLGAVTASSVTYIPPVVALLIGALVVGEPIEFVDYAATSIIFIGVFLLKRGSGLRSPKSIKTNGPTEQLR
jgi:drug/metabolite transporter (DMT)-like permease